MMRWLLGMSCVLLSCNALAVSLQERAREQAQASMVVTGSLVVAADGHVHDYTLDHADKVPEPVRKLIDKTASTWKFEPVLQDGKPVLAKTAMSLRVVVQPGEHDSYDMAVKGVSFGGFTCGPGEGTEDNSFKSRRTPDYPKAAVDDHVSGVVYLLLRVNPQGEVDDVAAEQVNLRRIGSPSEQKHWRHLLAHSAVSAARHWVVNPLCRTDTGDLTEDWFVRIPVDYSLYFRGIRPKSYGQWQAYMPGPRQQIPWAEKRQLASSVADALLPGGVYPLAGAPRLATP